MKRKLATILQRRQLPLWLDNNGMKKAKKSGYWYFDFVVGY